MYIPSYQIHNVLNVYRNQLSKSPGTARAKPESSPPPKERINISSDGQRESIMEKISSEIVDRIARFDHDAQEIAHPQMKSSRGVTEREDFTEQRQTHFSYTSIDEHNRKITNTLPIQKLNPMSPWPGPSEQLQLEDSFTLEKE